MRAVAALAALVLVAGVLVVGWHKAAVAHGVCTEHGEELHLQRLSAPAQDHGPATETRIGASTWELRDGDHHCTIAATSRDPATAGVDAPVVLAADEPVDLLALPAALADARTVLYRLAPKTSPPV